MKTNNFLKKMLAIVLVFAMLAPTMGNLGTNVSKVQAEDTATGATSEKVIYEIVSKDDITDNLIVKDTSAQYEKCKDYLFAGWYQDAAAKTAAASKSEATCARFVPAELLNVKCQVTNGLVTDTSIDSYKDKYVLRFVSSIDSLDYKNVGFEISYTEDGKIVTRTNTANKVFKRIESTTGLTSKGTDMYEFSPKVISTKSEYFVTAKWPVAEEDKAVDYTVRAFWTTKDGTKVYGADRCVSVEDGLEETCKTRINLPLQNTLDDKATYSATYKNASNTEVTCSSVEVLATGTDARLTVTDKNLKSVTEITIKDSAGNTIETVLYRNLYTEYTGTADTTWYDKYSSGNEFIIATSADLYGLASLVNKVDGEGNSIGVTFEDKTIYLVSDIKVNEEKLITERTDTTNYKKWYSYDVSTGVGNYVDAPTYTDWIPIGRVGKWFNGTFDGQMHSISGIYCADNTSLTGLFARTYQKAEIKNLKLTNSYFASSKTLTGSIAGRANSAKFNNIYSDAIVDVSTYGSGGIVGYAETITMNQCWFDGIVSNSSTAKPSGGTGGLLGDLYSGTATLSDCLNTGYISNETTSVSQTGGLIGRIYKTGTAVVTDCLNVGTINANRGGTIAGIINGGSLTTNTSYAIGSDYTVGYTQINGTTPTFTVNYILNGQTKTVNKDLTTDGSVSSVTEIASKTFTGADAVSSLEGFDFNHTWTVVTNGTPVLKSFEDEIINPDISWYSPEGGSAQNPYILYDKDDLYGLALLSQDAENNGFAGKVIRLGADIVVNKGNAGDWTGCAPQYEWTPIGSTATTAFAGIFDGSDPETGEIHTISGIYLNTSSQYAGLFGVVQTTTDYPTATVKNLKLKNSYIFSSTNSLGSVVGYVNGGTIDTVYSNATVKSSGGGYQGGIVGVGKSVTIDNSWFAGNVINTNTSGQRLGGFVGEFSSGTLTMNDCLNTGIVTAAYNGTTYPLVAGFVGNIVANLTATMTDCLNTGRVTTSASIPGVALAGCVNSGATLNIYTSYSDADKCTTVIGYAGGTVKSYDENNTASSVASKATTETTMNMSKATTETGVIAGFDFEHVWEVTDATPILKSFAGGVIAPDTTWYDDSDTYILYNAADLYGFSKLSQDEDNNFEGKKVQLGADIVVNEGDAEDWAESAPYYSWKAIGSKSKPFVGTFDGQGHTISGIYLNTSDQYAGLFAYISKPTNGTATVQNLKLINSYFETTGADCGSIAGRITGVINNVYSDAIVVSNSSRVGGFVGMGHTNVDMDKCWFAGQVVNTNSKSNSTGGFIGNMYVGVLTMDNCLNTGLVDVSAYRVLNTTNNTYYPKAGGFIGLHGYDSQNSATATITNCLNTGTKCVYDVVNTSYGAFTGYMNPTSSLTVNSSYVDSDKCDGRGYFAADNTTNPVDGYTTDIFKSYEEITGTNAETSLDGFDFTSTWKVGVNGNVILTCFEDMEVLATSANALHKKLITNDSLIVKTTTPIKLSYLTYLGEYYQGGCVVGDYLYQAEITTLDSKNDEAGNRVRIHKIDLTTNRIVMTSGNMELTHANDITYNSKLGYLVVCHNKANANYVSYVDPENLTLIDTDTSTEEIEKVDVGFNIYSIDYNAKRDCYVVGVSGGLEFRVLDSDFNQLYAFKSKDGTTPNFTTETYVTQGIGSDDNYVYCVLYKPNVIIVYDWYGNYVSIIDLGTAFDGQEPENISVIDDTIYVTAVESGACLYKIDASALAEKLSAE